MSGFVEIVSKRDLAMKIHYWAQDILKLNATCGLGTLSRGSTPEDVEHMLEGEE